VIVVVIGVAAIFVLGREVAADVLASLVSVYGFIVSHTVSVFISVFIPSSSLSRSPGTVVLNDGLWLDVIVRGTFLSLESGDAIRGKKIVAIGLSIFKGMFVVNVIGLVITKLGFVNALEEKK
jgi:hypothetical protein